MDAFRLELSHCVPLVDPAPRAATNSNGDSTLDGNGTDTSCVDYVGVRARALPFHLPRDFPSAGGSDRLDDRLIMSGEGPLGTARRFNLSSNSSAVFVETRPYQDTTYYVLVREKERDNVKQQIISQEKFARQVKFMLVLLQVVSRGEVSFEMDLATMDCGDVGIYGMQQRDW